MKPRLRLLILLLVLTLVQCTPDGNIYIPTPITNKPVPRGVDSLRILAIGNSFTLDGIRYLNPILHSAGIDPARICIYTAVRASYSLQQWSTVCFDNEVINISREVGGLEMKDEGTIKELLNQKWDVVVFQQYSRQSGDYSTFNPPLAELTAEALTRSSNPNVCIAWQLTWNYWDTLSDLRLHNHYNEIVKAAMKMRTMNGIDVIIPTGTAIENAKRSSLLSSYGLSRDGTHLAFGTGCYIAACTWFQTLVAPAFGIDLSETTFNWEITPEERAASLFDAIDVDDGNFRLCQKCAIAAVANPFSVTNL